MSKAHLRVSGGWTAEKLHLRTSSGIACGRWTGLQIATTANPGHVTCRACMKTGVYAAISANAAKLAQEGQN